MMIRFYGSILLSIFFITGCTSIMSGSTQQVTFQSTPDNALIRINGRPLGKTPLTIQLDKKNGQTLTIEKDGYKTFSTSMDTTLDPWFWGNILIGGLIGSTTDGINGSINEYSPGQYFITLESTSLSQSSSDIKLSRNENAKKFLFVNYNKLKKDLSKNSGEVIEATLNILQINDEERDIVISQLKESIFKYKDPAKFVDNTLKQYLG